MSESIEPVTRDFQLGERLMKKPLTALLLTLCVVLWTAAQTAVDWITYTSVEGHYIASFPQQPTLKSQDGTASTGEKLTQFTASSGDGHGGYMVAYFDLLGGMTFSFDKGRDGIIERTQGALLSESPIALGDVPGRQLAIEAKDEGGIVFIVRARFYDVNKRIYLLQCILPKKEDGPAIAAKCEKFFESFKIQNRS